MGIEYDSVLAKAELNRAIILISHHLRHIERNDDVVLARYFNDQLQHQSQASENVYRKLKRKVIAKS